MVSLSHPRFKYIKIVIYFHFYFLPNYNNNSHDRISNFYFFRAENLIYGSVIIPDNTYALYCELFCVCIL